MGMDNSAYRIRAECEFLPVIRVSEFEMVGIAESSLLRPRQVYRGDCGEHLGLSHTASCKLQSRGELVTSRRSSHTITAARVPRRQRDRRHERQLAALAATRPRMCGRRWGSGDGRYDDYDVWHLLVYRLQAY
jgi:hypothetical protein